MDEDAEESILIWELYLFRRITIPSIGRIVFFLMSEKSGFDGVEDCAISCYDNGTWTLECPEEDDEACIAQTYFINHWNYERNKKEK